MLNAPTRAGFLTLAVCSLLALGCGGFKAAMNERVLGKTPTVQLACTQPVTATSATARAGSTVISVRGRADTGVRRVGRLVDRNRPDNPWILLEGEPAERVLERDVARLLTERGFRVAAPGVSAPLILRTRVERLSGSTAEASIGEWKGLATGDLSMVLSLERDGRQVWSARLDEHAEERVRYLVSTDVERVLDKAYCTVLARAGTEFGKPEFARLP